MAKAKEAEAKTEPKAERRATPEPGTTRTGVDIAPADREVLSKPIDDRMEALLKDHQRMGARPK